MVTTFYPPFHSGGDAIYVYELSNELARQGHQVEVIHCRDAFALAGTPPVPSPPDHPNVKVHRLHSSWKWLSPLATQQTGRMGFKKQVIERILDKGDFDVIHYHNISLVGGLEVLSAGLGVKLYTLHDYWLICPTHVLFRNKSEPCTRTSCFRCQLIYKRPPQLWRSDSRVREAIQNVDLFLSGSRFCLSRHAASGLTLPGEVLPLLCKLPSGEEDSSDGREDTLATDPGPPYFLFVGRLEKLKGLQDVLAYFIDNSSHNLLIAGSGDYEQQLLELSHGSPNIRFLGQQGRSDLRALYKQAIATIVPSLTYEISPYVVAESWSVKTPVVVRDIGALKEMVEQTGGGLWFSSTEVLYSQLDTISQDNALREKLGEAGHEAYIRGWTPEVHIQRYLSIIDRVMESRHE